MAKTLFDVILEAKENIEDMSMEEARRYLQAERTSIPKPIAIIRQSFLDNDEYELYEFIQYCEWWMVKNKNAPGWMRTAGVRAANDKIEFYYDKEFIDRIAKKPGMIMFLIAHEADHIFRLHQDRQDASGKEGELWNSATDMIINKDIMATPKISSWAPEWISHDVMSYTDEEKKMIEKQTGKTWDQIKNDRAVLKVPEEYEKHIEKNKDKIRLPWTSDRMYEYLLAKQKKQKKQNKQPPYDYFSDGTIVKVNSGKHAGEYRKITGKDKQGNYITIPVDIQDEIRKVSGGK